MRRNRVSRIRTDQEALDRVRWEQSDTLDPARRLAVQPLLRRALGIPFHQVRRLRKPACAPSPRGSA